MKRKIIFSLAVIILTFAVVFVFKTNLISRVRNKFRLKIEKTESPIRIRDTVGNTYGIDVSHHQGEIEWNKVKKWKDKKINFVYIKATEGATYVDKTYQTNVKGAQSNNLLVGSYHYFRTTSSVKNQFRNFIKNVDKNKQDLIPLIDVEERNNWGNAEYHRNLQEFLDLVENHFGKKPIIYTVNSFYNLNLSGKYKSYHFLIGRYGQNPPNMRDKTSWTIWQFSETGRVDGIPRYVDINVINSKYSLQDLLMK